MNIGIFGGTFNPPHRGHLIIAESVRQSLSLDKIIFMPAFISPLKQKGESDLAIHRMTMTMLAISDNPAFECSDFEINKKNVSYTIETIEKLKKENPKDSMFLLIGADNYRTFHLWKRHESILKLSTLVVMNRPGFAVQANEQIGSLNTLFVEVPNIDISSTGIRTLVEQKKSIRYLVTKNVAEYIRANGLYAKEST